MADGKLIFDTGIDDSGFTSDSKKLKSTATSLDGSVGNIIKGIIGVDLIKKAGSALASFGLQSIDTASNLQEVQNVLDTTFGDASATINKWSLTAKEQYGLTELQAKQFTSTMGAMLKSSGLDDSAIVSMSTSLAGLSADMASFYNLDFETAFEKLQAGISGETEPLKQLGINMSVANLEAFALAQGIEKAYTEMSQAEQTTLRYNYLMQATADAQGDFAKTSDGYANQVRLLETNWASLMGNVGEALLPLATTAVSAINNVFDALEPEIDISSAFDTIDAQFDTAIAGIETKKATVETLIASLGEMDYEVSDDGTWSPSESMSELELAQWNTTLQTLVKTIPELTTVIDTQNGTINGGTEAILAHASAWEVEAKAQATQLALQEKYNELGKMKLEIAEDQVDYNLQYATWIKSRDDRSKNLQALVDELNKNGYELSVSDFINEDGSYNSADYNLGTTKDLIERINAYNDSNIAESEAGAPTYEAKQKLDEKIDKYNEETEAVDNLAKAISETTTAGKILGASHFVPTARVKDLASSQIHNINGSAEAMVQNILNSSLAMQNSLSEVETQGEELGDSEWKPIASVTNKATGIFATIQTQGETLDHKTFTPTASLNDTASKVIAAITSAGTALASKTFTPTASATDKASGIFASIQAQGTALASKTYSPTISAIDKVSGVVSSIKANLDALNGKSITTNILTVAKTIGSVSSIKGYATGLRYVPEDDFLARLHEGEAVLTKAEATLWRAGRMPTRSGNDDASSESSTGSFQQINHFNVPVQTPDEFAKTMYRYQTYGLQGGMA